MSLSARAKWNCIKVSPRSGLEILGRGKKDGKKRGKGEGWKQDWERAKRAGQDIKACRFRTKWRQEFGTPPNNTSPPTQGTPWKYKILRKIRAVNCFYTLIRIYAPSAPPLGWNSLERIRSCFLLTVALVSIFYVSRTFTGKYFHFSMAERSEFEEKCKEMIGDYTRWK